MPAFREWMETKFPQSMRELVGGGIDRRRFLHLMAASLGLAGVAGCRRPELKALPYAKRPEGVVPGLPNFYATAMPRAGTAFPVLVESHEGRPTKIEGNPRHAESGGASDAQAQASVLDLYDPDRSSTVLQKGQPSSWREFDAFAGKHFTAARNQKGKGAAHPERGRGFALPRLAARQPANGHARGALARLRAGQPDEHSCRGEAGLRRAGCPAISFRSCRGHSHARL